MISPVEGTVLDGFGDVLGREGFRTVEIGNGARDFQDTVMRPRAESHFVDGQRHDLPGCVVQLTILPELLGTHPGIGKCL